MWKKPQADAIDRRMVLRVYAGLLCAGGLLMAGWGPLWLGTDLAGVPYAKAALVRMLGASMILTGCFGAVLAEVRDLNGMKRGQYWFLGAQTVGFGIIMAQMDAVWQQNDLVRISQVLMNLLFLLGWLLLTSEGQYNARPWRPQTLFGQAEPELRSRYEEGIRTAAAQEERHRLARELHDSIKQQIYVVQTAAATAEARYGADDVGTRAALKEARGAAREAMTEMEAMLDQLKAAPLENTGLVEALKRQCEALGIRTGAEVRFAAGALPPNEAVAPGAQQAVYRVAQEALANVGRHARASKVEVRLEQSGRDLFLRVEDDGAGFDLNGGARGMGLANMRARAEEQGGAVEVRSGAGRGTVVELRIPCLADDEDMMMWHLKMAAVWGVMAVWTLALMMRVSKGGTAMRVGLLAIAVVGAGRSLYAWSKMRRAR